MSEANQLKERAALASIAASFVLTLGKLVAGLASGSLAILSEAGHNLADVAATILTYFAIRIANKPADADHHYGHGKVEALAALVETGFLFGLAVYILVEAIRRLMSDDVEIEANGLAFGVLIVSIVIDLVRWRSLNRIAAATRSEALAADALHFSSDIVSSALALCGSRRGPFRLSARRRAGGLGGGRFRADRGLSDRPAHGRHAYRRGAERPRRGGRRNRARRAWRDRRHDGCGCAPPARK